MIMDSFDEYELLAMLYCMCQYSERYNNQVLQLKGKETLDVHRKKMDELIQRIFENIDVEEIEDDEILPWIERVKQAVTADLAEV